MALSSKEWGLWDLRSRKARPEDRAIRGGVGRDSRSEGAMSAFVPPQMDDDVGPRHIWWGRGFPPEECSGDIYDAGRCRLAAQHPTAAQT